MANCYLCDAKLSWRTGTGVNRKMCYSMDRIPPENMTEDDKMCGKCCAKLDSVHNPGLKAAMGKKLKDSKNNPILPTDNPDSSMKENTGQSSATPTDNSNSSTTKTKPMTETVSASLSEITSASTLTNITDQRHNQFKAMWQKGRVVQFKNDKIAILMRAHNSQVQFIVAFDQVTREGFRLMSIDEGKEASAGGFTGGVTSYYYFQKMEFVR
jgi:hypothetical protein